MTAMQDSRPIGDVALVTGGAGAIGGAIAVGLMRAGVAVGLVDRDEERLQAQSRRFAAAGGHCYAVAGDVTIGAQVRRVADEVAARLGPIDILMHTAGIFPRTEVLEMEEYEWDRVLSTNLRSAFLFARAVLPGMVQRGRGRMVSIGSDLADLGVAQAAHYAASKAGLHALTRCLAKEVGGMGVTVNCVLPGLVDTPMMRASNSPEYIAAYTARMPDQRLGAPEDCAGLALFLTTPAAERITGQILGMRSAM
jgi:NAD(P)-dependent dehydrogenase (short-subunit alcohol dehydrogenase family)